MGVNLKDVVTVIGGAISQLGKDEDLKGVIFGRYTDGSPRSIIDAFHDEILSPGDRDMLEDRMKEIRKKRKKKAKKKAKKKKKDFSGIDVKYF